MAEKTSCLGCGKDVEENEGFTVIGKQYIEGLPSKPVVHNFQCLINWDATGDEMLGNQGFNLDKVELVERN